MGVAGKILITTKEGSRSEAMVDFFRSKGCEVDVARDAHQTVLKALGLCHDLAIVRDVIPDLPAQELALILKKLLPKLQVVIITGEEEHERRLEVEREYRFSCFEEPVNLEKIWKLTMPKTD